jgi:hypothetical protein
MSWPLYVFCHNSLMILLMSDILPVSHGSAARCVCWARGRGEQARGVDGGGFSSCQCSNGLYIDDGSAARCVYGGGARGEQVTG